MIVNTALVAVIFSASPAFCQEGKQEPPKPLGDVTAVKAVGTDNRAVPSLVATLNSSSAEVRGAAVDALATIGAPAVEPLVELMKLRPNGYIPTVQTKYVQRQFPQALTESAIEVLTKMDPKVRKDVVIPALRTLRADRKAPQTQGYEYARINAHHALALLDPGYRSRHFVDDEPAEPVPAKPDNRTMEWITGPGSGHVFPYYRAAACQPDVKHVDELVKAVRTSSCGSSIRLLGMTIDSLCGAAAVPELVKLLEDHDWYVRWSAATVLEVMKEKANGALPALERVLANRKEDVDVRVAAARAIAVIKGISPFELYPQIENLDERLIETTKAKSLAWRQEYMKREGASFVEVLESGMHEQGMFLLAVFAMATDQHVAEVNKFLRESMDGKLEKIEELKTRPDPRWAPHSYVSGMSLVRILGMFHSRSRFFPGRLEPETEAAMKRVLFDMFSKGHRFDDYCLGKKVDLFRRGAFHEAYWLGHSSNGPVRNDVLGYLTLAVLKDDPEYRNRSFNGYPEDDTVIWRYNCYNKYWDHFLKDWCVHGLRTELGSSYEKDTYGAHWNLIDLSPDPKVRSLAAKLMDLHCIELEQISIGGLRAGGKGRCKSPGVGTDYDPPRAMLYAEKGVATGFPFGFPTRYQAPDAAILLRKLGFPEACFEIRNRFAGGLEPDGADRLSHDSHERRLSKTSRYLNYVHATPEYMTGGVMFDPNRKYQLGLGCEGRWRGVIFRDLNAINMNAYKGEKMTVQDKDVMISQKFSGAYYCGRPEMEFTAGFDKVEKDGWLFLNNDEAYAAINVLVGGYVWKDANRGLLFFNDMFSPFIIQTGRKAVYHSFENFQEAMLNAKLKLEFTPDRSRYDGQRLVKVDYTGPHAARLEFFADRYNDETMNYKGGSWVFDATKEPFTLPRIDGKELNFDLEHNYYSPYMKCKTDSGYQVDITFGDRKWVYDLATATASQGTGSDE